MSVRVNTSACIKDSSTVGSGKHRLCSALLILAGSFSVLHCPGRPEAVSGSESGAVLADPGLEAAVPQLPCRNASEGLVFPSLL